EERAEGPQSVHHELTCAMAVGSAACLPAAVPDPERRSTATRASAKQPTAGAITSRAASEPGQCAPAPSAPQNVPNAVSMIPTTNFSVFSGTRASGALTANPTSPITSTA